MDKQVGDKPVGTTYLTARELAERIKYKPNVINNMLKDSVLIEGSVPAAGARSSASGKRSSARCSKVARSRPLSWPWRSEALPWYRSDNTAADC
jgi:hypothetical protein